MTVYFAPRSNYYGGFLGALGQGAAGIVTNLIGQQVAGMFDRANRAREVEAARAVAGALGDTAGMNEEQMLGGLLTNPQWGKMSPEAQKQWMYLANLRGQNYGGDMYRRGVIGQGGTNAQADTVIGAHLLGLGDGNVGKTIDWTHPRFETQLIDQGDQYTIGQIDPYRPGGIVSSSMQMFDKTVLPEALLKADVEREGYRNAVRVANINRSAALGARNRNNYQFVNMDGGIGRYDIDTNTVVPLPNGVSLITPPPKMTADELALIFNQLDDREATLNKLAKSTKDLARLQSIQQEQQAITALRGNIMAAMSGAPGGIVSGAMANSGGSSVWQATYEAAKADGKSEEEARQMADYKASQGR